MSNETEQVLEQLSALVDGELDMASQARLTQQLLVDPELNRRWQSYHRSGELLRGEWSGGSCGFAQRVSAAIAEEAPLQAPVFQLQPLGKTATQSRTTRAWLRPVAGMALAASVAVVTVFSVRLLDASGSARDAQPAMAEADAAAQKANAAALATVTAETDKDKRLALQEPPPASAPAQDVKLVDYDE